MGTEERLERIEKLILISSKNVLSVREAALMLDISDSRVRHLISEKALPHYKQGKKLYLKKSEMESWMLSKRFASKSEIESKASTYVAISKL